jgi:hypothetical protein
MIKRFLLVSATILMLTLFVVVWRTYFQITPIPITPTLSGETEYCITCHTDVAEISPSHPVETFGCVICHGGERLALDADLAHSTMRGGKNPSDLQVVEESCGGSECHSGEVAEERDHIQRVKTTIQATYAGAITNIRYTYGAQKYLVAQQGIFAIERETAREKNPLSVDALTTFDPVPDENPSILEFASNCLYCHISASPDPDAQRDNSRFTGCAACHTPTIGKDINNSDQDENRTPIHQLTTAIPYTQCNTCHNQGNYNLRTMTFDYRDDKPFDRLHDYYQPIAQFTRCEWTLDCADCHTRHEAMGDGNIYSNQAEQEYIQCRTCHGTIDELPLTKVLTDPEDIAFRLSFLNPVIDLKIGDIIIVTDRGEPMWNIRQLPNGTFEQFGKASGQRFTFRPVKGTNCEQDLDQQESQYCHQCHAVER